MPLKKGSSKAVVSANVKELKKSGKKQSQPTGVFEMAMKGKPKDNKKPMPGKGNKKGC